MRPDYFDLDRRPFPVTADHLRAVAKLTGGVCTDVHLRFMADVVQAGGCFTGLQAEVWLDSRCPNWAEGKADNQRLAERQRFLQPFFLPMFKARGKPRALAENWSIHPESDARFAHFCYTPLYAALGVGRPRDSRTDHTPGAWLSRLLVFDYLADLAEPWTWYGRAEDQVALLSALGLSSSLFPCNEFGKKGARTRRYMSPNLFLGLWGWRLRFVLPMPLPVMLPRQIPFFRSYAPVFAALRALGLCVEMVLVVRKSLRSHVVSWCRGRAVPPARPDRVRLAHTVEGYALRRAASQGDHQVIRVYGGREAFDRRLARIDDVVAAAPHEEAPMEVDVWHSGRLASAGWSVPDHLVWRRTGT